MSQSRQRVVPSIGSEGPRPERDHRTASLSTSPSGGPRQLALLSLSSGLWANRFAPVASDRIDGHQDSDEKGDEIAPLHPGGGVVSEPDHECCGDSKRTGEKVRCAADGARCDTGSGVVQDADEAVSGAYERNQEEPAPEAEIIVLVTPEDHPQEEPAPEVEGQKCSIGRPCIGPETLSPRVPVALGHRHIVSALGTEPGRCSLGWADVPDCVGRRSQPPERKRRPAVLLLGPPDGERKASEQRCFAQQVRGLVERECDPATSALPPMTRPGRDGGNPRWLSNGQSVRVSPCSGVTRTCGPGSRR